MLKYEREELPVELHLKAYREVAAKLGSIPSVLRLFFCTGESAETVAGVFVNRVIASGNVGVEMFLSNFDDENQVLSMLISVFFPEFDEKSKRKLLTRDLHLWYQVCEETEMIMEEAGRYFAGSIIAKQAAEYTQNRISIYLAEQS